MPSSAGASAYHPLVQHYASIQEGRVRQVAHLISGTEAHIRVALHEVYLGIYEAIWRLCREGDQLFVVHAGRFYDWNTSVFRRYLASQHKAIRERKLILQRTVVLTPDDTEPGHWALNTPEEVTGRIAELLYTMVTNGAEVRVAPFSVLPEAMGKIVPFLNLGEYRVSGESLALYLQYYPIEDPRSPFPPEQARLLLQPDNGASHGTGFQHDPRELRNRIRSVLDDALRADPPGAIQLSPAAGPTLPAINGWVTDMCRAAGWIATKQK